MTMASKSDGLLGWALPQGLWAQAGPGLWGQPKGVHLSRDLAQDLSLPSGSRRGVGGLGCRDPV